MSYGVFTELWCDAPSDKDPDICGRAFSEVGTVTQVRALAKAAGWLVSQPGGKDYCPEHRDPAKRATS